MEDIIVDGLCIRAVDFKEKDKIVCFYCGEIGKISVIAKGCKSAKAKLKLACSPFCFGKYHFCKKNEKYILIGFECHDSFFKLTQDIDKYYSGMVALEFLDKMCLENDVNNDLFVVTLKFLNNLCYSEYKTDYLLNLFLKRAMEYLGYYVQDMSNLQYFLLLKNEYFVEIKSLKLYNEIKE